ncbi:galactokinase [Streptomyces sp. ET3-23]|uniref:galactokinase n=1 Tax=Streptomyces sp. ET3-23 TaxID=2885643 RepID=UPI001D10AF20|nr:galactokinase [Streptomyces sp. ET3-23]MCC2278438.1 galactokinase [Streptomyces sp. ET3-23]
MTTTAENFRTVYGKPPAGVWAAPGRVNLIGEYTDFNDGFVMPFALPHCTRVAAAPRTDGRLRLYSRDAQGGVTEEPRGWAAYPAGVAWALREAGLPVGGADVYVESDVPVGAGLSSSAALEVATALALTELYDAGLPGPELARLAQRAENAFVGVPCGIMDQMASACCRAGHALHLDTRDLSMRQIPLALEQWGLRLLVIDTRVKHELGDGAYAARRAGCESAARRLGVRALREVACGELQAALGELPAAERPLVRHVVTENDRVERVAALLAAGDSRAAGPLLTEGHASLRDDFRVSCAELDVVVETAVKAGALGARMTGGGFGGSAIALVDGADEERVTKAVTEALGTARVFGTAAGEGARRVA